MLRRYAWPLARRGRRAELYHSVIGKRLVECVNRRDGTNYTVREFFDEVYIPLFFGASRFLQNIGNSPFYQEVTVRKRNLDKDVINKCLIEIHHKVKTGQRNMSILIGGPATNSVDTTSGQVTALQIPIPEEDVYASWIGTALGLTVQGGYTLLIDANDVLLTTYDGWKEYRRFLDQSPKVKSLQVNTWNGQWVASRMGASSFFDPITDKDGAALETQKWVQLLFALSDHYREGPTHRLLAYVYSLGQSNKTLGFVRLNLPEVRRLVDLYRQLFTVPPGMPPKAFEALYETDRSFETACERTEIGLRALKPKDVFKAETEIPKPPKATDAEKRVTFDTYQTWIIAMLNNKDLLLRA